MGGGGGGGSEGMQAFNTRHFDTSYLKGTSKNPSISGDGRKVAFQSRAGNLVANDTNIVDDILVHDLETGETIRVSVDSLGNQADRYTNGEGSGSLGVPPGGGSYNPSISRDGRYIAFESTALHLVPDDTNGRFHVDIFVHDVLTGETTRVSVGQFGQPNGVLPKLANRLRQH